MFENEADDVELKSIGKNLKDLVKQEDGSLEAPAIKVNVFVNITKF